MSGSPFRERRIPPDEVRRIVKRASELAMVGAEAADGMALTEAELTQRLAQLGIAPEIATRAMQPLAAQIPVSTDGVTRVVREMIIDGMVPTDHHEELADAINDAMKMQGRVSVVGNKLTWVPGTMLMEPAVTVHSKNGLTRIHYVETLASRAQATVGLTTVAAMAGISVSAITIAAGVAIAKAAAISAQHGAPAVFGASAVIGIAAAVASALGLRRAFAQRSKSRSAFADEVMARVVVAARAAVAANGLRVRVDPPARAEAAEIEDAAETEGREAFRGEEPDEAPRAAARRRDC